MTCAVVEHINGRKTHHTNVFNARVGVSRRQAYVKLLLSDDTIETIKTGVSVHLVTDEWFAARITGLTTD